MVVGEFTTETELVVIGGGPGGYAAAIRAAELGLDATIVDDRPRLGGTWLHEGCILSRELVALARTVRAAADAGPRGIEFGPPRIDPDRIRRSLAATVADMAKELETACETRGVTRIRGTARFDSSRELTILDSDQVPRLRFRRALIATGARPHVPKGVDHTSDRIMTLGDALRLPDVPAHLLIVGGSTAALEVASVYAALGSRVTLVEPGARLLSCADADLVAALQDQVTGMLDELCLGTRATAVTAQGDRVTARFEGSGAPRRSEFDRAIVATGRRANLEGLALDRTRIRLDEKGFIVVDDQLRTTDPRIFAVGDVIGRSMLALPAAQQGRVAAEVVAGWGSRFDARVVPRVVFTDPQIAWCGVTEAEAAASGHAFAVEKTRWEPGAGRAFTKIVFDPDTRLLLGVAIIGPNAAELIGEAALAIEMGAVTTDLAATIHPHPTSSESISAAAQQADSSQEDAARSDAREADDPTGAADA